MKPTLAVQICTAHSVLNSGSSSSLVPMSSISSTYLFLFGFHVNVYRLGGLRRKKGTKRRALPCTHAQILRTIFFDATATCNAKHVF